MASMRVWRDSREARTESGAVAVEFALVVPVLLLVLFGIVDFGLMINRDSLVNNSAREAARRGTLVPEHGAIEEVAESVLESLPGDVAVIVTCEKPDGTGCTVPDTDAGVAGNIATGDAIIVEVEYEHDWITFLPTTIGQGDATTLSKTIRMRVE